jgi:aminopeptidase-like protein
MKLTSKKIGDLILGFSKKIFNINRSITGEGNRRTLSYIKTEIKDLKLRNFSSNKKVFDWNIPLEWKVNDAYILTPKGEKICNLKENFLHVASYSEAVKETINLNNLKKNLITLKKLPQSIPYATNYYKKQWNFCIAYNQYKKLKKGKYFVNIESKFKKGKLDYGELIIRGRSKKEIFLTTYICHPNLANNEVSGISLLTFITKWLKTKKRNYTYRIVFAPETIGSIAYLEKNFKIMKKNIIAGYILTCVGDNRNYSYLETRQEFFLTNKIAIHVLRHITKKPKIYDWSDRGSDERQYCSPKINLPLGVLSRTKFGEYKEYHTSSDQIGKVVNSKGLGGSFEYTKRIIETLENIFIPISIIKCEPFFEKRKIKFELSTNALNVLKKEKNYVKKYFKVSNLITNLDERSMVSRTIISNLLWHCDGKKDTVDIANIIGLPIGELNDLFNYLIKKRIIKKQNII